MRYLSRFQRANRENRITRKHRENRLRQGPKLHLVECHSFLFTARRRNASCDWPRLPSTPASGIEPAGGQQREKQRPDVSHGRFARTGVSKRKGGHTHTHTHTHAHAHAHARTHTRRATGADSERELQRERQMQRRMDIEMEMAKRTRKTISRHRDVPTEFRTRFSEAAPNLNH